jgi:uncharacterized membrane protein YfcA
MEAELKSYAPIIFLLLIITGLTFWSTMSGVGAEKGLPSISPFNGVLLAVVGLAAGLVGGVIGTGGCSVVLPILHLLLGGSIKLLEGFVFLDAGLILAAGVVVGAQAGAALTKRFKTTTLKLIFGLYFLYVSMKFITGYFGISIW